MLKSKAQLSDKSAVSRPKTHRVQTDNASLPDKIFLRQKATEHLDNLRVLDLYAGENLLWKNFDTERYYGIEIVKNKGKNLRGDCRKIIDSLDLSGFNVIDCDSYGIPFDVIMKTFENKTLQKGTVIIYTAIANKMSGVNKAYLKMVGMENMYQKTHALVAGRALDLFYRMLEKQGVCVVQYYAVQSNFTKHYGYFIT